MQLSELISSCGATVSGGDPGSVRVCDITEDSRTVLPGSLFIARKGLRSDGRVFAEDAVGAGAVAILTDDAAITGSVAVPVAVVPDVSQAAAEVAELFYGNPSDKLAVIAVTGTNGKTTTASLVWQILNGAGVRCGLIGTVEIDDGATVAPASMTTPPAIEMSRSLSVMVEHGCRAVVLEASSHALDQKRVDGLKIDVGVFTNLTGDHLDYHGTMERYADAKARLFAMLPASGRAVVNADDPWHGRVVGTCRAPVVRCRIGVGAGRDATAELVGSSIEGMDVRLRGPWGVVNAHVPLIGSYNLMNTLQAVAACHAAMMASGGVSTEAFERALPVIKAPSGRLEPVRPHGVHRVGARRKSQPGLPLVFVDFAHSDDALRNVLTAARGAIGTGTQHLWAVFGCGGDKDRTKRPRMGLAAAELADRVVVTSDNPRSEQPSAIVTEILAGIPEHLRGKVEVQVERAPAIRHALEHAAPGDIVVIAGKGHETEQIVSDGRGNLVRSHFDDREVAGKILAEMASAKGRDRAHA